MKKVSLILLAAITTAVVFAMHFPVFAGEVASIVTNGDRVSVFGDITVDKKTVGSVVAIFGNVDVQNDVKGDVVAVFGNINVKGPVDGEVVSILGSVDVRSKVSRQVVAVLGKVRLSEEAVIMGDLISIGSIGRETGARVYGQEIKVNAAFLLVARAFTIIVFAFLVLIFGLFLISIFKSRATNISFAADENPAKRIVLGIFGFIAISILTVFLSIIVVGPLLFLIMLVLAEVAVSIFFGKQILKVFSSGRSVYLEFVTGLTAISLFKIILTIVIPQFGFAQYLIIYTVFDFLLRALGTGILLDTRFGGRRYNNRDFEFEAFNGSYAGYADSFDNPHKGVSKGGFDE